MSGGTEDVFSSEENEEQNEEDMSDSELQVLYGPEDPPSTPTPSLESPTSPEQLPAFPEPPGALHFVGEAAQAGPINPDHDQQEQEANLIIGFDSQRVNQVRIILFYSLKKYLESR